MVNLNHGIYEPEAGQVIAARVLRQVATQATQYAFFHEISGSYRLGLQEALTAIASAFPGVLRCSSNILMIESEIGLAEVHGIDKKTFCSLRITVYGRSNHGCIQLAEEILSLPHRRLPNGQLFKINWKFIGSRGMETAEFDEMLDDDVLDEAYPYIEGGVREYIGRYLDSYSSVLVLIGIPGTGKTRLVRQVFSEISRRKGDKCNVTYTTDERAIRSDDLFIQFVTGDSDVLCIEDADESLLPRSDGNRDIHKFLTASDGVVRALGRKIIFTTNLPNISQLDDALVRPGRCFDVLHMRPLTSDQAAALLGRVEGHNSGEILSDRGYTVAEIYDIVGKRVWR